MAGYQDDMMGLSMYDGLDGFMPNGAQVKEALMVGGAGAVGILAASAIVQRIPYPATWEAATTMRVKNVAAFALGLVGARVLYDKNRDAAVGLMGGVCGLALAQLAASFAPETLSTSLSGGGLSSADLAALESAVATNSASWRAGEGLSAPMVQERQLASTGTTQEELAQYDQYMGGQSAYAPSF